MGLRRRQFAFFVTLLYVSGGLLLLYDYLGDPAAAGAHLPLAWHVFPVSIAASLVAFLTDRSAPLDPSWYVPVETVSAAFIISLATCAAVLLRAVGGPAGLSAEEVGDGNDPPENLAN